ncbi:aspartate 1-decarboxylase [Actinomadura bangladeshensis]|uniref:Aspartate 1-decarboxylase n=1 Tax=Actinomadura bangladeshensis TaxID=453573 RepID=A0A4R4NWW4_9ACTN|nr:aspartate 1-decarboxylase [Actinomadura bangladeshensis]TDC12587.1 hypothetical protein E1284_22995 [Actinomadura bangladeshensis]
MQRTLMNGKIHRATVTQADLHYVGSPTIGADLTAAADIVEGEQVHVVHVDAADRIVALGADPSEPVPGAPAQMAGR